MPSTNNSLQGASAFKKPAKYETNAGVFTIFKKLNWLELEKVRNLTGWN
jgi:hypothetical protein